MTDDFDLDELTGGEAAFFEALQRQGDPASHPLSAADHDLIEQALAQESAAPEASEPAARRGTTAVVATLVAVAAAALVWVAWPTPEHAQVERGRWSTTAGESAASGDALPMAVWLVADDDEACGSVQQATLCAQRGTVVKFIVDDRGRTRAEVEKGRVTVASGTWTVVTAAGEKTLSAGESLEVQPDVVARRDATPNAPTELPQAPLVPPPPQEQDTEEAPQAPPPSAEPKPRAPKTDPADLLKRARALRGQGDAKGGAKAYSELLRDHPRSPEANVARVSLGQLRLEAGRPKAALALFERYLRRGGSLSEEALWGKIRALKALGRKEALGRAIDELERKYPRSVYRSRARSLQK